MAAASSAAMTSAAAASTTPVAAVTSVQAATGAASYEQGGGLISVVGVCHAFLPFLLTTGLLSNVSPVFAIFLLAHLHIPPELLVAPGFSYYLACQTQPLAAPSLDCGLWHYDPCCAYVERS
jgi:hypothetical protein